ncbi:hypothetical protein F4778DRAFT_31098 [Xylariomycetidae sp. FL2044]|nr:hypothetical protein F4778DRAFT_31098 [Xylariomycetidae sp. FL2044]
MYTESTERKAFAVSTGQAVLIFGWQQAFMLWGVLNTNNLGSDKQATTPRSFFLCFPSYCPTVLLAHLSSSLCSCHCLSAFFSFLFRYLPSAIYHPQSIISHPLLSNLSHPSTSHSVPNLNLSISSLVIVHPDMTIIHILPAPVAFHSQSILLTL